MKKDKGQEFLKVDGVSFKQELWEKEWQDMPEFITKDLAPFKTIMVHFENLEDMRKFSDFIGQKITIDTKSLWYPAHTLDRVANKRYIDEDDEKLNKENEEDPFFK